MSGHSKWAKIKRQKGANDAKRGALFTKLAKNITLAASEGGGDPTMNFGLRLSVEKAKQANMPLDNINRAIKKGTGEIEGGQIQKINYEGIGPAASAFIVACSTDNTNRTVSEIRRMFDLAGGSLGASGSAMWNFEEKGVITIKPEVLVKSEKFGKEDTYEPVKIEDLELELFDIEGIIDIKTNEGEDGVEIDIYTEKQDLGSVHKKIEEKQLNIQNAELQFIAKDPIKIDEAAQERVLKLMDELDDHDDVDNVFVNIDLG